MKTGNTVHTIALRSGDQIASMEPGHEDREYLGARHELRPQQDASMEPGHEDREYVNGVRTHAGLDLASMEPGHEDREYVRAGDRLDVRPDRLNGARS